MATKQEKQAALLAGLEKQKQLMRDNAELMEELHPHLSHHLELNGAADITDTWIKGLTNA